MVACLVNGNIVIGWRARLPGPLLVHLQIFDANGPVGGEQTTGLDITEAAMTALDSGRFVIAHVRSAFDGEPGFETTIAQASVFEASGAFSNIRFPATAEPRIQSSWPTLAPLPGGRFLLAWTQLNVDNVAAGIDVKGRIFSSRSGRWSPSSTPRRAASDSAWLARQPPAPRVRSPWPPGRTTARAAAILPGARCEDGR